MISEDHVTLKTIVMMLKILLCLQEKCILKSIQIENSILNSNSISFFVYYSWSNKCCITDQTQSNPLKDVTDPKRLLGWLTSF